MSKICNTCHVTIDDIVTAVECDKCHFSYHARCLNLTNNDMSFLNESGNSFSCQSCTTVKRILRSNSAGSGSSSVKSTRLPSATGSSQSAVNEPLTVAHFNQLMSSIQMMAADIVEIKIKQDDVSSKLAACVAKLESHSELIADNSSAVQVCVSESKRLDSAFAAVSADVGSLTARVSSMESVVAAMNTSASRGNPAMECDVEEIARRVSRSHNVIVRRLAESENNSDLEVARNLICVIDENCLSSLVDVSRLGDASRSNPRPLRISFRSPSDAKKILRNKNRLSLSADFRKITVHDDKTPIQMKHLEGLRKELKIRQTNGEGGLTIKFIQGNPQIVHRPSKN